MTTHYATRLFECFCLLLSNVIDLLLMKFGIQTSKHS